MKIRAIIGIILIIIGIILICLYGMMMKTIPYPLFLIVLGILIPFSEVGAILVFIGGIAGFLANYFFSGCHGDFFVSDCPWPLFTIVFIFPAYLLFAIGILYGLKDGIIKIIKFSKNKK